MSKKRSKEPKIDNMDIRYTIRVSDDADKRISEYCKKTGKNKSDLIREAVMKHVNEKN